MVRSIGSANGLRDKPAGLFPAAATMLSTRRRCDYCGHWIAKGIAVFRCPVCDRVYHDECLRELGCGVTAAALRRSRRAGVPRHWKCGKCDDLAATDEDETNPGKAEQYGPPVTATPLSMPASIEPKRLNFSALHPNTNDSNADTGVAASLVKPPPKHLDHRNSTSLDPAGGPPVMQKAGEEVEQQILNLAAPFGEENKLQLLNNVMPRIGMTARVGIPAAKRKNNVTTLVESPRESTLTPAPKRIRKQTRSVSKSAKSARSVHRVGALRLPGRVTLLRRQLRAARRKPPAKQEKPRSVTCANTIANGSSKPYAITQVAATANAAAVFSPKQLTSSAAHSLAGRHITRDEGSTICTQQTYCGQTCRERFEVLEAKFERIVTCLRDSFRAEILSLQMAQQHMLQQNEAASGHRMILASEIDNINRRLNGVSVNAKGSVKPCDTNRIRLYSQVASKAPGTTDSSMNSECPTIRSATSLTSTQVDNTMQITSCSNRTRCVATPAAASKKPAITTETSPAVATAQRKRVSNSAAVQIIRTSQRLQHRPDCDISADDFSDDNDRIAIICGDSHLRKMIRHIKRIVRPLNEELAFHCEDGLTLDAALKNAIQLVTVATDADLKVVILAGLADILHSKNPDQTRESLVTQLVEFTHFCREHSVDLTVCSIPVISGPRKHVIERLIQEANQSIQSAMQNLDVDFLELSLPKYELLYDKIQFVHSMETRAAMNIGGRLCTFLKREPQPFFVLPRQARRYNPAGHSSESFGGASVPSPRTSSQQPARRLQGFHQTRSTRQTKPNVKERRLSPFRQKQSPSLANEDQKHCRHLGAKKGRQLKALAPTVTRLNSLDLNSANISHARLAHRNSPYPTRHNRVREARDTVETQNLLTLLQTVGGQLNAMQRMMNGVLHHRNQPLRSVQLTRNR